MFHSLFVNFVTVRRSFQSLWQANVELTVSGVYQSILKIFNYSIYRLNVTIFHHKCGFKEKPATVQYWDKCIKLPNTCTVLVFLGYQLVSSVSLKHLECFHIDWCRDDVFLQANLKVSIALIRCTKSLFKFYFGLLQKNKACDKNKFMILPHFV